MEHAQGIVLEFHNKRKIGIPQATITRKLTTTGIKGYDNGIPPKQIHTLFCNLFFYYGGSTKASKVRVLRNCGMGAIL